MKGQAQGLLYLLESAPLSVIMPPSIADLRCQCLSAALLLSSKSLFVLHQPGGGDDVVYIVGFSSNVCRVK